MSKQDLSQHLTQDVIHEYTAWMRRAVEYLIRGAIFAIVFYFLYHKILKISLACFPNMTNLRTGMPGPSAIGAVEKASKVNFSSMRYRLLTLRAFLGIGDMCFQ